MVVVKEIKRVKEREREREKRRARCRHSGGDTKHETRHRVRVGVIRGVPQEDRRSRDQKSWVVGVQTIHFWIVKTDIKCV